VILDLPGVVLYGEAKWRSKEAKNQGVDKTKSQLQLRRDFLGDIGPRVYGKRNYVVLGIVLDEPLEQVQPPDARGVNTASVRWEELATYPHHP
jgi:hypothetical protein